MAFGISGITQLPIFTVLDPELGVEPPGLRIETPTLDFIEGREVTIDFLLVGVKRCSEFAFRGATEDKDDEEV